MTMTTGSQQLVNENTRLISGADIRVLPHAKPYLTIAVVGSYRAELASKITVACSVLGFGKPVYSQSILNSSHCTGLGFCFSEVAAETQFHHYTLIHSADHQQAAKNLLCLAPRLDGLLWETSTAGVSGESKDLLELASKLGIKNVIVLLVRAPSDTQADLDFSEAQIRRVLQQHGLNGNETPIVQCYELGEMQVVHYLVDKMDEAFSQRPLPDNCLVLPIEHPEFPQLSEDGVAFGRLERGTLRMGDRVKVVSSLRIRHATVTSIVRCDNVGVSIQSAKGEDFIRCFLSGVTQREINQSYLICDTTTPVVSMLSARFTASLYYFCPETEQGLQLEEDESSQLRLVFLRQNVNGSPADLSMLTKKNMVTFTRMVEYIDLFQWKSRAGWSFEQKSFDLRDAIPLVQGMQFLFYRGENLAGFGVVISVDRR
jgi:translation elongation factor EF-Tu-like GTPase